MLKRNITREELKNTIGEENIITHYFGSWDYGRSYNSVFREDQKSSTGFYASESGSIIYNDLRTGEKYDFVHFVMKKFGISYYGALKQIAADFGLFGANKGSTKVGVLNASNSPKKALKKAFIINTYPFKKQHLDYWADYGITLEELKFNNIHAVESFIINKFDQEGLLVNTYSYPPNNEIKFVYTFTKDQETYVKIYIPFSKDFKWFGDVPLAIPFGLDTLSYTNDTLIITKSVKDCLVIRKFWPDCIGLQNESVSALDVDILAELQSRYKNILIWFDYDRPGLYAYNQYKKFYKFKPIWTMHNKKNVWQNLTMVKERKIKDPSDFVKRYGIDVFKQYLQYIKLI